MINHLGKEVLSKNLNENNMTQKQKDVYLFDEAKDGEFTRMYQDKVGNNFRKNTMNKEFYQDALKEWIPILKGPMSAYYFTDPPRPKDPIPQKPGMGEREMGNPRYKYVLGPFTYDVNVCLDWRGRLYPTKVTKSGTAVYDVGGRGDILALLPDGARRLSQMTVEERREFL